MSLEHFAPSSAPDRNTPLLPARERNIPPRVARGSIKLATERSTAQPPRRADYHIEDLSALNDNGGESERFNAAERILKNCKSSQDIDRTAREFSKLYAGHEDELKKILAREEDRFYDPDAPAALNIHQLQALYSSTKEGVKTANERLAATNKLRDLRSYVYAEEQRLDEKERRLDYTSPTADAQFEAIQTARQELAQEQARLRALEDEVNDEGARTNTATLPSVDLQGLRDMSIRKNPRSLKSLASVFDTPRTTDPKNAAKADRLYSDATSMVDDAPELSLGAEEVELDASDVTDLTRDTATTSTNNSSWDDVSLSPEEQEKARKRADLLRKYSTVALSDSAAKAFPAPRQQFGSAKPLPSTLMEGVRPKNIPRPLSAGRASFSTETRPVTPPPIESYFGDEIDPGEGVNALRIGPSSEVNRVVTKGGDRHATILPPPDRYEAPTANISPTSRVDRLREAAPSAAPTRTERITPNSSPFSRDLGLNDDEAKFFARGAAESAKNTQAHAEAIANAANALANEFQKRYGMSLEAYRENPKKYQARVDKVDKPSGVRTFLSSLAKGLIPAKRADSVGVDTVSTMKAADYLRKYDEALNATRYSDDLQTDRALARDSFTPNKAYKPELKRGLRAGRKTIERDAELQEIVSNLNPGQRRAAAIEAKNVANDLLAKERAENPPVNEKVRMQEARDARIEANALLAREKAEELVEDLRNTMDREVIRLTGQLLRGTLDKKVIPKFLRGIRERINEEHKNVRGYMQYVDNYNELVKAQSSIEALNELNNLNTIKVPRVRLEDAQRRSKAETLQVQSVLNALNTFVPSDVPESHARSLELLADKTEEELLGFTAAVNVKDALAILQDAIFVSEVIADGDWDSDEWETGLSREKKQELFNYVKDCQYVANNVLDATRKAQNVVQLAYDNYNSAPGAQTKENDATKRLYAKVLAQMSFGTK